MSWENTLHPRMVLSVKDCEERTSLAGKTTAILATGNSPLPVLMWSVFALLLRSEPQRLEHFMVAINGPDARTGDPALQDRKQAFLEDLRGLRWHGRDMPLTVIRVWSRVGHAQALEMAIPWVHTEFYTLLHDDVILRRPFHVDCFEDRRIALAYVPPLFAGGLGDFRLQGQYGLGLPHLNSAFLLCRKSAIMEVGTRWWGYHVPFRFHLPEALDAAAFVALHAQEGQVKRPPQVGEPYDILSIDIGGWMYRQLSDRGYGFAALPADLICHLGAISWSNARTVEQNITRHQPVVAELEAELERHPEFLALYRRWRG